MKFHKMTYKHACEIVLNFFEVKSSTKLYLTDIIDLHTRIVLDTSSCTIEQACLFLDELRSYEYYLGIQYYGCEKQLYEIKDK